VQVSLLAIDPLQNCDYLTPFDQIPFFNLAKFFSIDARTAEYINPLYFTTNCKNSSYKLAIKSDKIIINIKTNKTEASYPIEVKFCKFLRIINMKNKLKNVGIATVTIAIVATIFGAIDRSPAAEKIGTITQPLNVARKSLWSSPNVRVCWETAGSNTEKNWVRQAVSNTWETTSMLNFTGWGQCNANSKGIRIQVTDVGPHTTGLGNTLDGKSNGMVLNFTFANWSTGCQDGGKIPSGFDAADRIASTTEREYCIKAIAVHEFGHAVGIAHEQNRAETDGSLCAKERQGSDGDWNVTPYDLKSVMNYCNPSWNGNGQLSNEDRTGISLLYGKGTESVGMYAAIWQKTSGGAWIARHGLTSSQYQSEFDKYLAQGYRLTNVSGYTIDGKDNYAAIWEKSGDSTPWVARHGMTPAQYQAEFNKYVAQGYRLAQVSGYSVNGQERYAAIWDKSSTSAWTAKHGMTSAQYQAEFNKNVAQGYRLAQVNGYSVNGRELYAAIWDKSSTSAWTAKHGMTSAQYQAEFNKNVAQGYRLAQVSGYSVNGQQRYAGIWDKSNTSGWIAKHGMRSASYQAEFDKYVNQGYRLVQVSSFGL
jgi:Bacterial tandem repeat domain 1/Matrixin